MGSVSQTRNTCFVSHTETLTMKERRESMNYCTIKEMAERWGVSEQLVRRYCRQGRIENLKQVDGIWFIPEKTRRPQSNATIELEENLPARMKRIKWRYAAFPSQISAPQIHLPRLRSSRIVGPVRSLTPLSSIFTAVKKSFALVSSGCANREREALHHLC